MLALAEHVGRQTAHQLIYDVAVAARERRQHLRDALLESEAVTAHLTASELDDLFDYRRHTGQCGALVDRVLGEEDPEEEDPT